jgi:hypothetical protein
MAICRPNGMGLANLDSGAITAFATTFKDYPPRVAPERQGDVVVLAERGNGR